MQKIKGDEKNQMKNQLKFSIMYVLGVIICS